MTISIISMIRSNWGGSEELWAAMAEEALMQGHEVLHLSFEHTDIHPKMKRLVERGLKEFYRIGFSGDGHESSLKKKWIIAKNFLRKKLNPPFRKILSYQPDIVIYNGTCLSIAHEKGLINQIKNKGARFYMLSHYFSPQEKNLSDQQKVMVRQAYELAEKSFFVDEQSKTETERYLSIGIDKAVIVRNPVNISSTDLISFPDNPIAQFATVGNLVCSHKGQDLLLEVLAQNKWKERDWQLNIYGAGPDAELLKKYVVVHSLEKKVFFHGKVNDIRSVWAKNQLLIMPSRMEGMPLAVVEAMLCGRPSVATNVGGITEWLENDSNGFIAAIPNIDNISGAMEKAWSQRDRWPLMGENAHRRAMELYDANPGQNLLNLIEP